MQIRFKDSDRAGKTSLLFNMGMPYPRISSHLLQGLMYRCIYCAQSFSSWCFLGFFRFFWVFFRKNQQMELQRSLHAEPHRCALSRMDKMRSRGELPNKKVVQRSSAGRWLERNHLQFTRSATEHTTAFDSNAKALCIKCDSTCLILTVYSSWHWHSIW